jgi:Flagellar hook-length control protein FliK
MDPISTSPLPLTGGIRPAQALQSDLASVLRQGRIVAGEVLELLGGGSIVIGLAGQRVHAESHVDLAAGDRFLARIDLSEGEVVLQLAGSSDAPDDALLRALRTLAGSELDARSLFERLASTGTDEANLPAVFEPGSDGRALTVLVRQGGLFHESAIRAAIAEEAGAGTPELALDALARRILGDAGLSSDRERSALLGLLRDAISASLEDSQRGPGTLRAIETAVDLRADLVRTLGTHTSDPARTLLRGYLASLDTPALERAGWLPWIGMLLGERADLGERTLQRRALVQLLQQDFKSRLASLAESPAPDAERDAAGHALRALEAEQLRNVARERLGEPTHVPFLVPDGAGLANAHLRIPARRGGSQPGEESEEPGERISVGVEYSRLGALQAEILLKHDRLHLRLCAARPETVARLREAQAALEQLFSDKGRELCLSVLQRETDRTDVAGAELGYLREHHLMDLSG